MTDYLGFNVLEVEPHWPDAGPKVGMARSTGVFDPRVGRKQVDDQSGQARERLSFSWFLETRADHDVLNAFLAARKGQAVPFWVPTWRQELVLSNPMLSSDANAIMKASGYTKFRFPSLARRDVAIILSDGTKIYRRVTGAVDGGAIETLSLSSTVGSAVPVTTLVCHLLLVRLASDGITRHWHNQNTATVDLQFVEVPKEVP